MDQNTNQSGGADRLPVLPETKWSAIPLSEVVSHYTNDLRDGAGPLAGRGRFEYFIDTGKDLMILRFIPKEKDDQNAAH